jgi:hypothetical protein
MNRIVSRFAYRFLLRLHPASFQNEFGAEMLWIFDEENQQSGVAYLLFDGAISLLRQRFRMQNDPGQSSITSGAIITGPGMSPVRLLQGGVSFLLIFFSLIRVLSHPNPFFLSVKWADRMSGYTITLQAPSHAEVVLDSAP